MEIRVLGPIEVLQDGRRIALGGRRQRSVLAGLVAHAGRVVSVDQLIETVWGHDAPPSARPTLQTYVSRLRNLIGDDRIERQGEGYRLHVGDEELDAERFTQLATDGRDALPHDAATAWQVLGDALSLWRGTALGDVDANGPVIAYAQGLEESRLRAIEDRVEAGLAMGRDGELTTELRSLVEAHPLRERFSAQLALALYRSGRQAEALDVLREVRERLADDLGIDPSVELRDLEERVLRQDPALDPPAPDGRVHQPERPRDAGPPAPEARRNPYKGLRSFGEADADDYFGREELVADLADRLDAGTRLLALTGPSGSGKSSLVSAGLVPEVRARAGGGGRLVARMTPGTHPFAQLAAALGRLSGSDLPLAASDDLALLRAVLRLVRDEHDRVLLVVDQFEELLTGDVSDEVTDAFVRNLAEAVEDPHGQLDVVLTLRSDFLDRALDLEPLADHVARGLVSVPPMTDTDLRSAIVGPAEAVGLTVTHELVVELLGAASRRPGSLPLLQFVLTELTDRALTTGRDQLTLADLRDVGGFHGALARRADAAFSALQEGDRLAARELLLRLVAVDVHGEATRRVVPLEELAHPDAPPGLRDRIVETFVRERLLTLGRDERSGQATVEVAHEAVLGAWPRFAGWIEAARDDLLRQTRLEAAAAEWEASDRSPDYLLTGTRLSGFDDVPGGGSSSAAALLAASRSRRAQEEAAEAERIAREEELERRSVSRLRAAVGVLVTLLVVAGGLSAYALGQRADAERQRADAERQRQAALDAAVQVTIRQLTTVSMAEAGRDPELALLFALHAVEESQVAGVPIPAFTQEAIHRTLQQMHIPYPVADAPVVALTGGELRGAYDLPVELLVRLALDNVSRELRPDECDRYLGGACPEPLALDLATLPDVERLPSVDGPAPPGATVQLAGVQSGLDARILRNEFARFTAATGIVVEYNEVSDLETRVLAGEAQGAFDVVLLPQPGTVATEARAGRLLDLGLFLDREQFVSDFGPYLTGLASPATSEGEPGLAGALVAVPTEASLKSAIWYSPAAFEEAGYEVPSTLEELEQLTVRIASDGSAPWCVALGSDGVADGWPGTDWVEDLLLAAGELEAYDGWVRGEVPFTDPRIVRAFETFDRLALRDGHLYGGRAAAEVSPFYTTTTLVRGTAPACWLYHQATFIANVHAVGEELAYFPTPPAAGQSPSVLGGGGFAVAYSDRPEVRALLRHIAGPAFGQGMLTVVREGEPQATGFLAANRRFDPELYPDPWRREAAETLRDALAEDRFRFDASDLMPPEVGQTPFYDAMLTFVREGLDALPALLDGLDDAMTSARDG